MPAEPVAVRRETETRPTYKIGPPDLCPPIRHPWGYYRVYPYPLQDEMTDIREDKEYTVLVLENEHVRVSVYPEIGGHTYLFDRASGTDVFYHSEAVKPAQISLRGAWVAGGIEFNFPCSHNYVTYSTVDHAIRENDDGSATIYIGAIEQVTRMRWTVGITLRPGAARIETDIRLENRTGLPHRYYFWSNSSERVTQGTRFITTARSVYGWLGVMRYPYHNGEYAPAYSNHHVACDLFSRNVQAQFFGCYADDTDEGVVNVADHRQVRGRKYFTWGNSDDGLIWQDILSDNAGPYIEIQSGPFETQSIFKLMEPHQVMRWSESWYGIRGTGGFEFANDDVAMNLRRVDGDDAGTPVEELVVYATRTLEDASIAATVGDRQAATRQGTLEACTPVSVPLDGMRGDEPVRVRIVSDGGATIADALLPWVGVEDDLEAPAAPVQLTESVHDLANAGLEHEQQFDHPSAKRCYGEALARDANAPLPLTRLGVLELIAGKYEEAADLLARAAEILPDSGEIAYYLGCAMRALGRRADALDALSNARLNPHFGAMGRYVLGEMASVEHDFEAALEHFRAAADHESVGAKAWCAQAAMLRTLGRVDEATALLDRVLDTDPLNPLAYCERCLVGEGRGASSAAWNELKALVRGEAQSWLELVSDYAALGLFDTAKRVIDVALEVSSHAMLHYHAAHYLRRLGRDEEAAKSAELAAAAPTDHVFPHRAEEEAILREAIAGNPADANALYYLGTYLYMADRTDKGRAAWRGAADKGCSSPALHAALAWTAWKLDGELSAALRHYDRAIELDPSDHRLHADSDNVREALGASPSERLKILAHLPDSTKDRGKIPARLIQLHTVLGNYEEGLDIISERRFHPMEGERAMRTVYVDLLTAKGEALVDSGALDDARKTFEMALDYPRNVAVGKPYRPADAPTLYRAGCVCDMLGDSGSAESYWSEGASESHHPCPSVERYYVDQCLIRLGRTGEAEADLGDMLAALAPKRLDGTATIADLVLLGLLERAAGAPSAARRALKEALEGSPWDVVAERELRRTSEG